MVDDTYIHGTCVAVAGFGVLLRGPSRSGKSDLALRLIDEGAQLVADDQCIVEVAADGLVLKAPAALSGLLEVHGLGVIHMQAAAQAPLALIVDLVIQDAEPQFPKAGDPLPVSELCGFSVPTIALWGFAPSSAAKVRLAVHALAHDLIVTDQGIE
ncbi:MAG: HPr kinase/phosphorylase [Alphaproteobacteria bacterium]